MTHYLAGRSVLVTGGTGSFGHAFVRRVLAMNPSPKRVCVLSRDELKQAVMREEFNDDHRLRFFLGDVRDEDRLRMAFREIDVVVHAAALKRVDACEYNPEEAVKTNIGGARNVIRAAIDCGVKRVVGLSSDKATAPLNVYGTTKLASEKLFVAANAYSPGATRFACTRYGNVSGSRGSLLEALGRARRTGSAATLTDARCTRFWMTIEDSVDLVLRAVTQMTGQGEVFIPRLGAYLVKDMVERFVGSHFTVTGLRPGEKIHESLVSQDEIRNLWDLGDHYRLMPEGAVPPAGKRVPEDWVYSSDTATKISLDDTLLGPYIGGDGECQRR